MYRLKKQGGLSILEVLISMLILSIGVLGLAPLFMVSIYGNSFSKDMTDANALAQQEIESLVNWNSYGVLPMVSITDSVAGVYRVSRTVEDNVCNSSVPVGLVQITVVVSWTDLKALERTVYYSTLKPVV